MPEQPHSATDFDTATAEARALQEYLLGQRVYGEVAGDASSLTAWLATLYAEAKVAATTAYENPTNLHLRQAALLALAHWRDARYSLLGRQRLLAHGARGRAREIYEIGAADVLSGTT